MEMKPSAVIVLPLILLSLSCLIWLTAAVASELYSFTMLLMVATPCGNGWCVTLFL